MKKVAKIPLAGLSFVLFLLALILFLYFFTSVPEQRLNDWFSYYIKNKTGVKFTVEKVNRDIWHRIRLEGVRLYIEGTDKEDILIGHIDLLEVEYSIADIIFRKFSFSNVNASGLKLTAPIDEKGRLISPLKVNDEPGDRVKIPKLNIDEYHFNDIEIEMLVGGKEISVLIDYLTGAFRSSDESLSLKIDSLKANCPQRDFDIESCSAGFVFIGNNLFIKSLNLETSRSIIEISGNYGTLTKPDFDIVYDFSPVDLEDIKALTGSDLDGVFYLHGKHYGNFKKFEGNASGDVVLFRKRLKDLSFGYRFSSDKLYFDDAKGVVFDSPIAGNGYIDFGSKPESYRFKGTIDNLNLQNIDIDIYTALTGKIDLKGEGLSEKDMKMGIAMELSKLDIDIYHFHQAKGEIDFDMEKLNFHHGFTARYRNTEVSLEGYLEYAGQIHLNGVTDFNDLADFKEQFFITDLDGTGKANFLIGGAVDDFSVTGNFYSDSCRFYGITADTFFLSVALKSFISHKVGTVEGFWKNGYLYSVPVDSGYFSVLVSGEKYFLDNVYWENNNNQMSFSGLFDNGNIIPTLIIDTLTAKLWDDTVFSSHPLKIDVYKDEVEFKDFQLAFISGIISLSGTLNFQNQMDIDIVVKNLEVEPLANYFISDKKISGIFSGEIGINGSFDLPVFSADLTISDLCIGDINQGTFICRALYEDSELKLQPAKLQCDDALYAIEGTIPVNLSFTNEGDRFPEEPISVVLAGSGYSVTLLPVFVPSLEYLYGDFDIDIVITGTYDNPSINGILTLKNGTLKILELVDPITNIAVNSRMQDNIIYVDSISGIVKSEEGETGINIDRYIGGKTGNYGNINGSGTIKLMGVSLFDYDLTFTGKDCPFYTDAYDIQGITDIDVTIKGISPPVVAGKVIFKKLDVNEPFASFSTGAGTGTDIIEDSTSWDIELDISATNNLCIKNNEAEIELKGNVLVLRQAGIIHLLGNLDVIRGNFYLFGYKKFKIKKGGMIFNNISKIDPEINFEVTTRIRQDSIHYEDFDLLITGSLTSPEIHTSDETIYSDEDILMILLADRAALNVEGAGLSSNLISSMRDILIQTFNPFTKTGVIDEFDINPYEGEGKTRISVAKYISPKLFFRYSRCLSQEAGETVGIEYFFNDNLSFEGRQGTKDEGISFDLNFRYEF